MIEAQLKGSQSILSDPNATPAAKALARVALTKAAIAAANMHEATAGGTKKAKPTSSFSPEAQRAPQQETVTPDLVPIKTPHLTREQPRGEIRRSADAIGSGIMARAGTRQESLQSAMVLKSLSPEGKSLLRTSGDDLLSAANGARTRTEGEKVLNDFLENFGQHDRSVLQDHFTSYKATTGMKFLDSWKHKTEADVNTARVKNAASAMRKANKKKSEGQ
jgi:hypothetical protein